MKPRYEAIQADLTLQARAARLVMAHCFGQSSSLRAPQWDRLAALVKAGVGGFKLYHGYPLSTAALLRRLQAHGDRSLLVAADLERGLGDQLQDTIQFPSPSALGATRDPDWAFQEGFWIGRQARAIGINLVFGPLVSPAYPGISSTQGSRTLGQTLEAVTALARPLVQGLRAGGVHCAIKYFPGWGISSLPDMHSHSQPYSEAFAEVIAAGAEAVIVSHNTFPDLDQDRPALFSPHILQGLLRETLGFTGLIMTDALSLPWIHQSCGIAEAACRAIEAGVDYLVTLGKPEDTQQAIVGLAAGVESKRISEARLEECIQRVERMTISGAANPLSLEQVSEEMSAGEALYVASSIADSSIVLYRNEIELLPLCLHPGFRALTILVGETAPLQDPYRYWQLKEDFTQLRSTLIRWPGPPSSEELAQAKLAAQQAEAIILAFVGGQPALWMRTIAQTIIGYQRPVVGIWFAYPAGVEVFEPIPTVLLAHIFDEPAQAAALKAVFGLLEPGGQWP